MTLPIVATSTSGVTGTPAIAAPATATSLLTGTTDPAIALVTKTPTRTHEVAGSAICASHSITITRPSLATERAAKPLPPVAITLIARQATQGPDERMS